MPGVEIVYHVAASLDGFIAAADGGVEWLSGLDESATDHGLEAFYAELDGLILGRRTYEQVLGFGDWPYPGKPCWVMARSAPPPGPVPSEVTITPATPAEVAAEAAARGLRRVWLVGGGGLAASFRAAGLIDEYLVAVIPMILGAGIPLFGAPGPLERLRLVESQAYPTGVVRLRYRPEASRVAAESRE